LQITLFGRLKQLKTKDKCRTKGKTTSHDLATRSHPGKEANYESIHGLYGYD